MEIGSTCLKNVYIQLLVYIFVVKTTTSGSNFTVKSCSELLMGQFWCKDPEIDKETQQAKGCKRETRTVPVPCMPAPEITCLNELRIEQTFTGTEVGFYKEVPCKWTNGYYFETALLLSIFLGVFGIDRFYLGYPAIGLLKFSTLGFFFLGQLVDVLLIAIQVVKPSDGSDYVIDHYGAGLIRIMMDNETYIKPEEYS